MVGVCSGDWTGGVIVDVVRIPADLTPGAYVLGWRWDCEESTQVWASCADVTITAAATCVRACRAVPHVARARVFQVI